MKKLMSLTGVLLGVAMACNSSYGVSAKPAEYQLRDQWLAGLVSEQPSTSSPLSFVFGGKQARQLLPAWEHKVSSTAMPNSGKSHEIVYRDPDTGLQVTVSVKEFADFPAVEWVARFKNTGTTDTAIIENVQALDSAFQLPTSSKAETPPVLHWAVGGVASFDDFAPRRTELKQGGEALTVGAIDGRSSSQVLPFFNLENNGSGVVLGLGWSGRWTAKFENDKQGHLHATAGQTKSHLMLHPGEEIRTPRMLALFYVGDRWRGQNLLRQFVLAHDRPTKQGKPLVSPITCGNWGGTSATVHIDNINNIIKHDLPVDYYWIDAGWYGLPQPEPTDSWASNVGRWDLKKCLYPDGFKPLSDTLRKSGRELMLWFEPERVTRDTPWHKEHKDWLIDTGEGNLLMNLANPEARTFVTDFITSRIKEYGLGCYRQDFNMDPAGYWDKTDTPDRQGICENHYIEGLYAFWDGLLASDPNLIIDNCASGGRRIDLETIGRSTPYWRTDGPRDPIAHQCHTYGLLAWVPFSATSQDREGDDYEFRSSMCSSLCLNWDHAGDGPRGLVPADFPWDWAKKTLTQYLSIRDFYYGDYYPLTSYSQAADVWMAYQLDRPDKAQGLVVALRRPDSPYDSAQFNLRELDPQAAYTVTDLDTGKETKAKGAELMEKGLPISIGKRPGSALLVYRKAE